MLQPVSLCSPHTVRSACTDFESIWSVPTVRLGLGLAHEQLISQDETVSSMVGRMQAVAGVNGDFFDIGDSGMPLNIVVRDGKLLRSPSSRTALSVGKDGTAAIVRYGWGGSLVLPDDHLSYWIAGFNTGLVRDAHHGAVRHVRRLRRSASGPGCASDGR